MDYVESLLPQQTAQEGRQGRIDPDQLPDRRPRPELAVGRHIAYPVDPDIGRDRAGAEVVGRDVYVVPTVGHGLRQPQDADGGATRNGKRTGRDDGDS
jgi:hypothetical protein